MHTETCLYKWRLNGWALSIWIFGWLIALGLMIVLAQGSNVYLLFKGIIATITKIDTFLWSAYYSVPFFVLGVSTKIFFQRRIPSDEVFFTRVLQVVCGFFLTEYFYYAFFTYGKPHFHMFSPLAIVIVLLPFIALLPLLVGLLIGGLLGNGIIFLFPDFFEKSDKPR